MAQVTPVIFERADIRIDPVNPIAAATPTPTPALEQPSPLPRSPSAYNVELRSEDALQLEYIHALNTLTNDTGVVIVFAAPSVVALPRMQVFTAVDALFVAEDGTIVQIYPNVTLGSLTQDVLAQDPVKAFVFLKAGTAADRAIRPRDVITGSMFTPGPALLE